MDAYVEILVARQKTAGDMCLRIVAILITAVLAVLGLSNPVLLILAVIMGALSYFVYLGTDIEFEYLYVDKQLTIDKVLAKSRRKHALTLDMEKLEAAAPMGSFRLDAYKGSRRKTEDYSSGKASGNKIVLYYNGDSRLILENEEGLLRTIQMGAPRKVFLD